MKKCVWILDDDKDFAEALALNFEDEGWEVRICTLLPGEPHTQLEARLGALLARDPCDVALVDLRLGGGNGLECVGRIVEGRPDARVYLLTGYPSIATAVAAIKKGATDYFTKPIRFGELMHRLTCGSATPEDPSEPPPAPAGQGESLDKHEREYIEFVLHQCQGNISEAARRLGLHRQSLQRKLKKFPSQK